MIQQDLLERRGIGQELVERAGRQGGEGVVGRSEDGERTWAFERVHETGGRGGVQEGGERAGGLGGGDDVARLRAPADGAGVTARGRRQQDLVDDVDDAVRGRDVRT